MATEGFLQGDAIRDFVFPIACVELGEGGEYKYKKFCGTGFLIGSRGYALTAAHVVAETEGKKLAALFAHGREWRAFEVSIEIHPTQDVAVVQIKGGTWTSPFKMTGQWNWSHRNYVMWGYPEDALHEMVDYAAMRAIERPDLIYAEGYIRRKISRELSIPGVRGNAFFELSEVAGRGCSGGPINPAKSWELIGIYVAEKINDRATSVAFAVRKEAFRDWSPKLLGKSIREECKSD